VGHLSTAGRGAVFDRRRHSTHFAPRRRSTPPHEPRDASSPDGDLPLFLTSTLVAAGRRDATIYERSTRRAQLLDPLDELPGERPLLERAVAIVSQARSRIPPGHRDRRAMRCSQSCEATLASADSSRVTLNHKTGRFVYGGGPPGARQRPQRRASGRTWSNFPTPLAVGQSGAHIAVHRPRRGTIGLARALRPAVGFSTGRS